MYRYTECHYTVCHYTECHYTECHYTEYHYAGCHYTECRGAEMREGSLNKTAYLDFSHFASAKTFRLTPLPFAKLFLLITDVPNK